LHNLLPGFKIHILKFREKFQRSDQKLILTKQT
jgi:hypothetical protein